MTAAPIKQMAAPMASQRSGRVPSTAQSQASEVGGGCDLFLSELQRSSFRDAFCARAHQRVILCE